MVELKKKKRKRKVKPRVGQTITQKVIVNIGKTAPRRRTGTQAKRSVQPQQVLYQNQPIPLQPDYSSRINDLRDEVVRHLSGVDKVEGRRRALELRVEEGKQATAVQSERQDKPPPPRRVRSDIGVLRGELLRTAEKRAEERGFSLASVRTSTADIPPPPSLRRQATPPTSNIATFQSIQKPQALTAVVEEKRRGRPPGATNIKRKLVQKPKAEPAEEEASPQPDPKFV
mgnify:CR=1 FL=1|tara:strand:+ start:39 stop:725 length:687 start_codon:yes stop_codon:yes gene_type:complete